MSAEMSGRMRLHYRYAMTLEQGPETTRELRPSGPRNIWRAHWRYARSLFLHVHVGGKARRLVNEVLTLAVEHAAGRMRGWWRPPRWAEPLDDYHVMAGNARRDIVAACRSESPSRRRTHRAYALGYLRVARKARLRLVAAGWRLP